MDTVFLLDHWVTRTVLIKIKISGPKSSCPVCLKEMLKTNIPKHMKKKHAPDDPAECPFCFKVFKTNYNMKDHVRYMHK